MRLALAAAIGVVATSTAAAQSRQGARAPMERQAEIALARSAAPGAVSAGSRVWLWTGERYAIGDSGTTAVNCYVGRPWVPSVEPHCFDAEGSATIMPIQMRRVELYAAGRNDTETEKQVAEEIRTGRLRLPTKPAMTYMMSAAQQLVSGTGTAVGAWRPHLMIYYPNLTAAGTGLPGFVAEVGFVENPGTPFSAIVVPLATFVPSGAAPK